MQTRNTIQREIVFNAVNSLTTHPTPEEIYDYIRKKHPSVSRSTVYRNLNSLAENGDILKVRIPSGADRYDFNTKVHYHIVCEKCGRVDDIEMMQYDGIKENIGNTFGYDVKGYTVVFYGVCSDCK